MFAKEISKQTLFPYDEERFYYFIREGYSKDPQVFSRHAEGYGKFMKFYSELIDGRAFVDGYFGQDLTIGDVFTIDSKPEYRLKCIRFLV